MPSPTPARSLLPPLLASAAVALVCGTFALRARAALDNADYGMFQTVTEELARGRFRVFPFDQDYGGLVVSYARAAFAAPLSGFEAHSAAFERWSFAFSFLALPPLLALVAAWAGGATAGTTGAWVAGLVTAAGFDFWLGHFLNDLYPPVLFFAFWAMATKARHPDWLHGLSPRRQFVFAAATGLAFYANRLVLGAAVLAWLPSAPFWRDAFGRSLAASGRLDAGARAISWTLAGLGAVTWFLGPRLGEWNGTPLQLPPGPALAMAATVELLRQLAARRREAWRAARALRPALLGFLAGFSPEILQRLLFLVQPSDGEHIRVGGNLRPFPQVAEWLARLPEWLIGLFTHDLSPARLGTLLLFALPFLLAAARRAGSDLPEPAHARLLRRGVLLTVALDFLVKTMSGNPEHRYLYPVYAFWILLVACELAGLVAARARRPALLTLSVALLAASIAYQVRGRVHAAELHDAAGVEAAVTEVEERFASGAGLRWIVTDNYWNTYHFTHLSAHRITVNTARSRGTRPREDREEALRDGRAGFWLNGPGVARWTAYDREWCLTPLGALPRAGGFAYEGRVCQKVVPTFW